MRRIFNFPTFSFLLFFILTACNTSYTLEEKVNFVDQAEKYAKKHNWNYTVVDKSIVVEVLEKGSETETIQLGSEVSISYIGRLSNNKKFDQATVNKPFVSRLDGMIGGFQMGLLGKTKGTKLRLVIPPQFGYGDKKTGEIPENSLLIFEVGIVDVK